jgi:uncharacterized protein YmfQ (DUF2313 family)
MAFEDAYGEVSSTSYVAGYYDSVNDVYARVLQQLLPDGIIWKWADESDAYSLLRAIGYSFCRVAERAQDLLKEFHPDTMFEMLEDWERVLDLPGDNPTPPTTLAARRGAVHAKLLGYGDPTVSFFEAIAAAQGYTDAYVNRHFLSSFVPGSVAGDPVASKWQYAWEMVTPRGGDDALLQWSLDNVARAHGVMLMFWLLNPEQQSFDTPGSNTFNDVEYNGVDLWCAVGTNGSIQTSPDCVTWTKQTAGGGYTGNFYEVAYDTVNGLWCAVGSSGGIQTSPDGITWTKQTAAGGYGGLFYGVGHNQIGLWVAVGSNGEIQTSPDGTTWTARTAGGGYTAYWHGVAYGNGLWVIAGGDSAPPYYGKFNTSSDGITWSDTAPIGSPAEFKDVEYNGTNQFLAVGSDTALQTSADGIKWRARAAPDDMNPAIDLLDVVYAGNRWIVVGQSGELIESWYGEDWKRQVLTKTDLYGIGYGDGICCLVGGTAGDQIYTAEA